MKELKFHHCEKTTRGNWRTSSIVIRWAHLHWPQFWYGIYSKWLSASCLYIWHKQGPNDSFLYRVPWMCPTSEGRRRVNRSLEYGIWQHIDVVLAFQIHRKCKGNCESKGEKWRGQKRSLISLNVQGRRWTTWRHFGKVCQDKADIVASVYKHLLNCRASQTSVVTFHERAHGDSTKCNCRHADLRKNHPLLVVAIRTSISSLH